MFTVTPSCSVWCWELCLSNCSFYHYSNLRMDGLRFFWNLHDCNYTIMLDIHTFVETYWCFHFGIQNFSVAVAQSMDLCYLWEVNNPTKVCHWTWSEVMLLHISYCCNIISISFHLRLCLYVLKFFIKMYTFLFYLMWYIFCPSYSSKSIQIILLYVTGSVSLGWQKVWARSHAQPKSWVVRYQMKKKTACWPRERAVMSMIDRRPQMYTWLFLHWLSRCFKSDPKCTHDYSCIDWGGVLNQILHVWNICQLPFTRIAHS